MGFPILVRWHLYIDSAPRGPFQYRYANLLVWEIPLWKEDDLITILTPQRGSPNLSLTGELWNVCINSVVWRNIISYQGYSVSCFHYNDVIMGTIASQITSLTIVHSTVYSDADQRKHQSSTLLAFERGIHRRPVNSPHKWPVTRKMFPFDDVIMFHDFFVYWNN